MFLSVLLKQVQVLEAPDRFPCVLCMFVSFPFDQILPLSSELLMFEYSFDFVFLCLEFRIDFVELDRVRFAHRQLDISGELDLHSLRKAILSQAVTGSLTSTK